MSAIFCKFFRIGTGAKCTSLKRVLNAFALFSVLSGKSSVSLVLEHNPQTIRQRVSQSRMEPNRVCILEYGLLWILLGRQCWVCSSSHKTLISSGFSRFAFLYCHLGMNLYAGPQHCMQFWTFSLHRESIKGSCLSWRAFCTWCICWLLRCSPVFYQ